MAKGDYFSKMAKGDYFTLAKWQRDATWLNKRKGESTLNLDVKICFSISDKLANKIGRERGNVLYSFLLAAMKP